MLVAWPYFLLVATKSDPLARLINDSYGADAEILPILAIGMMVSAFAGPIDLTLLMLGRSQASLVGVAAAMATDIALLFVLAPPFGLVGAAIAWSAAVAVQNVVATWLVHRDTSMTQVARAVALRCRHRPRRRDPRRPRDTGDVARARDRHRRGRSGVRRCWRSGPATGSGWATCCRTGSSAACQPSTNSANASADSGEVSKSQTQSGTVPPGAVTLKYDT